MSARSQLRHILDIGEPARVAARNSKPPDFAALELQALRLVGKVRRRLVRKRLLPSSLPPDWIDDLEAAAYKTVPDLVRRWDPRKAKFETYVSHRLAGAMRDELEALRRDSIGSSDDGRAAASARDPNDSESDDFLDDEDAATDSAGVHEAAADYAAIDDAPSATKDGATSGEKVGVLPWKDETDSDPDTRWAEAVYEADRSWTHDVYFLASRIIPEDYRLPTGDPAGKVRIKSLRKAVRSKLYAEMGFTRCTAGEAAARLYSLIPPPLSAIPDPAKLATTRPATPPEREIPQFARSLLASERDTRGSLTFGGLPTMTEFVYRSLALLRRAVLGARDARRLPGANPDELPLELSPAARHGAVRHLNKAERARLAEFVAFFRKGALRRWIDTQPKTPADQCVTRE
jgi:hypothetical protein